MTKSVAILRLIVAALFLWPIAAWSADAEIEQLHEEIEALKQKVEEMEQEIPAAKQREKTHAEEAEQAKKQIEIGGALRYNFVYRDWDDNEDDKGGDIEFDIFRINVDGSYNDLLISAEYRWYQYMNVIHHGWMGYNFTDTLQGQFGVTKVPFGILPYASHSWWFGVTYYIGLEDDYDAGIKVVWDDEPWNLQLAFFKNADWGVSSTTDRYSVDVVRDLGEENEETNQVNARLAYKLSHGDIGSTELGISGMWGQLYNRDTGDMGDHYAAAVHLNGNYWGWNLMLEAARYEWNPENPPGISDQTVIMGAYATAFPVAAAGTVYVANLAYDLSVNWGPITKLTFYNDYSILVKDEDDFDNTQINTFGCLITAVPIYTYVDFIFGKNALFLNDRLGPVNDFTDIEQGLGPGGEDDWNFRFNVNVGYYF